MNQAARKALFIFFVALFVIATPTLVLYAQGYRINWPLEPGKKLVVMTGGFFLKTSPKQADIYVNGKLQDQTDFFFGSALLENFLPRQYQLEVKKTGYQSWEKTLEIKEKEVTEIRNINLFPDRITFAAVEKNADNALASPDKKKIALLGKDDDGWVLKLYDINKGVTSKLAQENDFSGKGAEFNGWKWSDDSKIINISAIVNKINGNYTISIEKNPPQLIKDTGTATSTEEIVSRSVNGNKYYLGKDGFIFKKDPAQNISKIGTAPLAIDPVAKYRLWVFGDYYFISKNSELYIKTPFSNSFKKLFDGLSSDIKLSPDGGRIVYSSDSEIWIYFMKNKNDQPSENEGNDLFIARLSEKIMDCDWYNSDYLIFTAGNDIKTAEIDTRSNVNIATLSNFSDIDNSGNYQNAHLIWNGDQKSAYVYLNTTFYKSEPIQ